ncbi:Asp-tRNA(Asn)/Glu-tRNA(Gln) amidotransferase GatCAB subunit B, partial [Bacillus atrophaeus]|nr:Asp-tRNA(Asn)/Glu-tRNA(Gln) amidotransferase GatCAB subunit B [Bacillus atrophaeus]
MRERFVRDFGVSAQDAAVLTGSRALAGYFEEVAGAARDAKAAANWVLGEVSAALNAAGLDADRCPVPAGELGVLIGRVA